jgi:hypothetical protein
MAIRTPGNPVVRRLGITLPKLRGVRREGGPAATGIDQFWDLQNVIPAGELVPRGGQQKFNAARLPGMTAAEFFNGMFDESVAGASVGGCGGGGGRDKTSLPAPDEAATGEGDGPKLYWSQMGPGGKWIMFYDEEKVGAEYPSAVFATDVTPVVASVNGNLTTWPATLWNGELWWPVDGGSASPGWGFYSHPPAIGAFRPFPIRKLWVPAVSTDDQINGPQAVWRGKLYFVLGRSVAVAPIVYEFDGVALVVFDTPPAPA